MGDSPSLSWVLMDLGCFFGRRGRVVRDSSGIIGLVWIYIYHLQICIYIYIYTYYHLVCSI